MQLRLRFRSFDYRALDDSVRKVVVIAERAGARVRGPVPLPTENHRFTVIRSPHKYKDSREHFEMRIHKRLLDLHDATPKLAEALQRAEIPSEVEVSIELRR